MEDTSNYRNIKETYKIEATLGKGSFATVKKAKHRESGERFAVKVMSKKKMSDEDKAATQQEIAILKDMDHPNIVNLIDVFEDERHWCLVMELMQGGELFDEILAKEHFSEYDAREATKSMIDAIQYCHEKGICHRDIKPENLLLKSKELGIQSLKVADFGLARLLDENTLASTTCGTPGYVAPEVLMQKPYGKSCDLWSIGVVAFILLSGTPPFYEEDNFALFEQIKSCKYEFEEDDWKGVSAEAKDFIKGILVADPKDRLSCQQMMDHPWMKLELKSSNAKLSNLQKLSKYVSVRKDKSKKNVVQDEGDHDI